ncbi:uncharacterized protein LOC103572758 isoform X1 [Microplitis demolitor]|uniref:uncharacterized protein LOC103572758 isoform X1 n=1 Tax=Microplitis demolitor TaxID=69319 RepID=UPI0004CD6673|nr:uncharacterized protein LOC103572758 isoform X1 [Microplitis demolitor]XP_014298827.1 uncharacterized protein LOC103572758 isoform X1 [Microplitis demolitor]XP_014298828.1 uncharacterized protein LOC103572758 isoform X1 [Microplitis demolitor]XP_053595976.1 uncharacterized protein LOC103572758 isoform X1 [Microplitis demolitor]XP_053595977.1 uncharacterized protein LOC103572758 isoform X1 [Microplitis demolitor]XP_053595978.1 uncharacterized protein LOC103572758 isoform X1 [Microplitis demo
MPRRRNYLLVLSIVINRRVMSDNEETVDVTVPYGSEWHNSLDKLIESLMVTEIRKETLKKILFEYLPTCPMKILEEKILSKVCPYLKETICELIDEITAKLEDPEVYENLESTTFDAQLIEIKNLLTRWENILKHVAKMTEVEPSHVVSLLEHFPAIVTKICLHCKEKRSNYLNRALPILLQDVYRETCSNVKLFCGFIYKSLDFQSEKDFELLKKLISDLGEIASITIYFLTTMIQTWKTFGKLTCDCHQIIKKHQDAYDFVTRNFKNICNDIVWVYKNMVETSDDKSKGGKCMNMLLEILYRIHKKYLNSQENELSPKPQCVRDMITFLLQLTGYYASKVYMRGKQKNSQMKEIFSHNWPDMFIKLYKNSKILQEELINRKEELASANFEQLVGYHIFLLKSDIEVDQKVQIAINNLNYFTEECMITKIEIQELQTEKSEKTSASIYEYTLQHICDCLRGPNFKNQELFIFKNLLSEKFWPSLFCFDVLQHLYRYSNEEFPFVHINLLSTVYEKLHLRGSTSLAVTLIGKLIISIYKSLSIDKKKEFQDTCQSPASFLLILKSSKILNSREKLLIAYKKLLPIKSLNLSSVHQELRVQPSVKNWSNLINLLTVISIDKIDENPDNTKDLQQILQSIIDTLNQIHDDFMQRIMFDLISILVNCTRVQKSADTVALNWNFFPILAKEIVHSVKLPDIYLIEVCHSIQRNSKLLKIPPGQVETRVIVINLICYLLSSSSPIVHQEALETFEYIVENGADEDLIMKLGSTLTKKYNLLEVVPNYLKKRSVKKLSHEFADIEDYLRMFSLNLDKLTSAHECFTKETREREKKIPKIAADSVDVRADKIADDLVEIIRDKDNLSSNVLEKLTNACLQFIDK